MLDMKLQKIINELQNIQHDINYVFYNVERWNRFLAETGNLSTDEYRQLLDDLCTITEKLEPYRN